MRPPLKPISHLSGLTALALLVCACTAGEQLPSLSPTLPAAPGGGAPTATPPPLLEPGAAVLIDGLQVSAGGFELTGEYTNRWGQVRRPPAGAQYLWAQVRVENTTGGVRRLPGAERFGVLYHSLELEASYGHRQDYPDYTALNSRLAPKAAAEGWLRFEIPAGAAFADLTFAFTPEGIQVSLEAPDRGPWSEHPVFLWRLTP
jgi:hypothetical protein